jgi:hypothetical protein
VDESRRFSSEISLFSAKISLLRENISLFHRIGNPEHQQIAAVAAGGLRLERVACACRPGTEGSRACNHGRRCGLLTAEGRDVGAILISEGLARRYECGGTSCPSRAGWC